MILWFPLWYILSPAKAGNTEGSDEMEEKVELNGDNMKHQDDASNSVV